LSFDAWIFPSTRGARGLGLAELQQSGLYCFVYCHRTRSSFYTQPARYQSCSGDGQVVVVVKERKVIAKLEVEVRFPPSPDFGQVLTVCCTFAAPCCTSVVNMLIIPAKWTAMRLLSVAGAMCQWCVSSWLLCGQECAGGSLFATSAAPCGVVCWLCCHQYASNTCHQHADNDRSMLAMLAVLCLCLSSACCGEEGNAPVLRQSHVIKPACEVNLHPRKLWHCTEACYTVR
jgi:hypothetical protein